MDSFLGRAAARVLEFSDSDLRSVAVVLPSQRAGVYFRKHLSEQATSVIFAPQVLTLDRFVSEFTALESADQIELLFQLYQSYREIWQSDAEPFDRFLKWAPIALADFSEMDAYMVNPDQFFRDLTNLKELDEWSLNEDVLTETQQNYAWFWKKLGELYHHFTAALKKYNLAYSGMLFRDAAQNIEKNQHDLPFNRVFFCGFNALSRSEEFIMEYFVQQKKAEMLWDADRFYMDFEQHEAGMFLRRNFKKFGNTQADVSSDLTGTQKKIVIAAAPNEIAQTDLMGHVLNELPDPSNTAVILANENLLTSVLNAIPDQMERVNVTMGFSTKNSPLHSLFELHFDWMNSRTDEGRYHYRHLLRLLSHPYLNFSTKFTRITQHLITAIKKDNMVFLGLDDIAVLSNDLEFTDFFHTITIDEPTAGKQLDAQFSLIRFIIRSIEKSRSHALEKEYLFHYLKVLRKLKTIVDKYPHEMNGEPYRRFFHALVSSDKLTFVGEPLEGLQVMGMLETRALDFKNLIILSCNEQVMPGNHPPQSLIPFELKKFYQLPGRLEKEAIYGYYFYRLLQRSENIHLVYSTDTTGWQGSEPSRYLTQLEYDLKSESNVSLNKAIVRLPDQPDTEDPLSILKSTEVLEKIKARLAFGISPSALNKFLNCPLDFYYTYIVGYNEADEVEETIEHSTLGSVVHKVLEKLYTPLLDKGVLSSADIEPMLQQVPEMLRAEFDWQHSKASTSFGMNHLIYKVAVQFVERFLRKEMATLKEIEARNERAQLIALETTLEYSFTIQLNGKSIPVRITGNADRIDQVGDTVRVLDYKTGKVQAKDLKLGAPEEELHTPEKSKALQLLMYGLMYKRAHEKVQSVTTANVSMRNLNELLISVDWQGKKALVNSDWDAFETILKSVIASMLNPDAPLAHRDEAMYCNFCDVTSK